MYETSDSHSLFVTLQSVYRNLNCIHCHCCFCFATTAVMHCTILNVQSIPNESSFPSHIQFQIAHHFKNLFFLSNCILKVSPAPYAIKTCTHSKHDAWRFENWFILIFVQQFDRKPRFSDPRIAIMPASEHSFVYSIVLYFETAQLMNRHSASASLQKPT